jgi:ACS family glucarate transporter-like MFS transporter
MGAEARSRGSVAPTRVRHMVLGTACSLAVLTYVQRQGFVAATPYVKEDLGFSNELMGYLGAVWLVGYGLFQVPGGWFGDRFGARHVLAVLVLGWSLAVGAVGLIAGLPAGTWAPFAFLVALQFLFAALQSGGFPVLARVVADWVPASRRASAQGTIWSFSRIGGALAPVLVVWLITQVFAGDWATPCWLLAALGLLWCGAFWPWFRDRPADMPAVNAAELALITAGRPDRPGPRARLSWKDFVRSRNVWALCLMYGFVGFATNFITRLLNIYLRDHRHLSDQTTAWLSGLPLACGIASCVLSGVLSDWLIRRTGSRKWGRRAVGIVTLALAGLACLVAARADEVWLLAVGFGAWMMFSDGCMGPGWASCADVGEDYAGTLSGAMNMTGAFIGAAGLAFAGRLLDRGDYDVLFLAFACSYALAALCWLAVDVTKPLVPRAEPAG